MADIQINQAAIATTVGHVLGVSSNGTLNRITLDNLLVSNFKNRGLIDKGDDANDCKESGIYNIGDNPNNVPADCSWSDLIVFRGYAILQVTYNKNNFKLYARTYSLGGSATWTAWRIISMV